MFSYLSTKQDLKIVSETHQVHVAVDQVSNNEI